MTVIFILGCWFVIIGLSIIFAILIHFCLGIKHMKHPCDECGKKGEAMPIYFYDYYEELKFLFSSIDNGAWLCPTCFNKLYVDIKKRQ